MCVMLVSEEESEENSCDDPPEQFPQRYEEEEYRYGSMYRFAKRLSNLAASLAEKTKSYYN